MRSLSAHSTNLLRSLWLAAQLSGIPATLPSFVSAAALQWGDDDDDDDDQDWTSIDPWCTLLVTDLCATDHQPLGLTIQPLLDSPYCLLIQPIAHSSTACL